MQGQTQSVSGESLASHKKKTHHVLELRIAQVRTECRFCCSDGLAHPFNVIQSVSDECPSCRLCPPNPYIQYTHFGDHFCRRGHIERCYFTSNRVTSPWGGGGFWKPPIGTLRPLPLPCSRVLRAIAMRALSRQCRRRLMHRCRRTLSLC